MDRTTMSTFKPWISRYSQWKIFFAQSLYTKWPAQRKNIDWMWTPFAESQRIHCGEFLLFAQFNATINHICRRPISILIDCRNIAWNGVSSQKTLLRWEIISRNHLQIFFFLLLVLSFIIPLTDTFYITRYSISN